MDIIKKQQEELKLLVKNKDDKVSFFPYGGDSYDFSIENAKKFLKQKQTELIQAVIAELESNPNEDGSISPNIQHWIEAKQRQLLKSLK